MVYAVAIFTFDWIQAEAPSSDIGHLLKRGIFEGIA